MKGNTGKTVIFDRIPEKLVNLPYFYFPCFLSYKGIRTSAITRAVSYGEEFPPPTASC